MATRRRDAGNSDLKARLGIQDAPEVEEAPPTPEEAPAGADAGAAPSYEGGYAAPAGGVESGASAAASAFADEDYSSVVDEELTRSEAPVAQDWRSSEAFAAPVQEAPKKLWVGLAAGGTVLGLVLGLWVGKVSEANGLYNQQTEQAIGLQEPVSANVSAVTALAGELESKNLTRYDASVDELLASNFGGDSKVVLSPAVLANARTVLAESNVGSSLTGLLGSLQTLDSLVKRHLALTQVDLPEIQAEIAGTQDQTKYAIVFDVKTMQARYQAHTENPTGAAYQLVPGFRVPFPDDIEVKEVRQGSGADYFYELRMPNGSNAMVPIYSLVSIDRSQMESGGRVETAQSRWVARVAQIKELLAEIQVASSRTAAAVEEVAGRGSRFSI